MRPNPEHPAWLVRDFYAGKVPRNTLSDVRADLRFLARLLVFFVLTLSLAAITSFCGGCIESNAKVQQNGDGNDADTSLVQLKGEMRAGRDVTLARLFDLNKETETNMRDYVNKEIDKSVRNGDAWSERLAILGIIAVGASYPIGKLVWIIAGLCKHKAKRVLIPTRRKAVKR